MHPYISRVETSRKCGIKRLLSFFSRVDDCQTLKRVSLAHEVGPNLCESIARIGVGRRASHCRVKDHPSRGEPATGNSANVQCVVSYHGSAIHTSQRETVVVYHVCVDPVFDTR